MTKPEGRVGPLIFALTYAAGFFGGISIILALVVKLPWAAMFFAILGIFTMTVVAILYEQSRMKGASSWGPAAGHQKLTEKD